MNIKHEELESWQGNPDFNLRICYNCIRWHHSDYIHCRCSGPWGGDIPNDKNCVFTKIEE
jgi:hypothetical protein